MKSRKTDLFWKRGRYLKVGGGAWEGGIHGRDGFFLREGDGMDEGEVAEKGTSSWKETERGGRGEH